jgi:hypothetical protein
MSSRGFSFYHLSVVASYLSITYAFITAYNLNSAAHVIAPITRYITRKNIYTDKRHNSMKFMRVMGQERLRYMSVLTDTMSIGETNATSVAQ